MIVIPRVTGPSPAAHFGSGVLIEGAVLAIAEQRIAHGMLSGTGRGWLRVPSFWKTSCRGNALAGGGPHVGDVEVLFAVVVVVEGAYAHSCANVFDACLRGYVGKGAVAVVAVEVLAAEVVDDVEVGPAIVIEVAPAAAEAIAGVVDAQTRFGGYVTNVPSPLLRIRKFGGPFSAAK